MALYDAVQICQMRSDHDTALKYGEQAAEYLAKANRRKPSPSSAFLLGRLYFRLGAIHAIARPRPPRRRRLVRQGRAAVGTPVARGTSPPIWAATARPSSAWASPTGRPASGRRPSS